MHRKLVTFVVYIQKNDIFVVTNLKFRCFILSYDTSYARELEWDMVSYDMLYDRVSKYALTLGSVSCQKYVPAKMLLFISHD